MKQNKKPLFFLNTFVFLILFFLFTQAMGQSQPFPNMDVGAVVNPGIEIGLAEGVNSFGKKTIFAGNSIDFGNVTFIHPELVFNGDAYLEKGYLRLEAVINIGITFGGTSSVALNLTRVKKTARSFHETYFSLSTNRSDLVQAVFEEPQNNRLTTLTSSATIPLRIIMEVSPSQQGRMTDRFRLEAQPL